MKITPLFDRVLVKAEEQKSVTKSGIILPSTSQERPIIAKVVAIGSGLDLSANKVEMQVKVGDRVLFNKFAGSEIKTDDGELVILRQIDIIGIVEEENE